MVNTQHRLIMLLFYCYYYYFFFVVLGRLRATSVWESTLLIIRRYMDTHGSSDSKEPLTHPLIPKPLELGGTRREQRASPAGSLFYPKPPTLAHRRLVSFHQMNEGKSPL